MVLVRYQCFSVLFVGSHSFSVFSGSRRVSVILVGSRWFSMFYQWLLLVLIGTQWFLVVVVCSQWFFMVVMGSQWFS